MNKGIFMKKICFALATVLFLNLATKAQIFELDEVKQIPTIDENNMAIIGKSILQLFNEAIKDPLKNSNAKAANETVYAFYDVNDEGELKRVNPLRGKQYSFSDSIDLIKNQIDSYRPTNARTRLLFNLCFDKDGKLLVPTKIYVISYRKEDVEKNGRRYIGNLGLLAFELTVSDSIKNKLSQVRLNKLAERAVRAESASVSIKLPFDLDRDSFKSNETKGKATKRGDKINITIDRYFKSQEEKNHFVELLKQQTDILQYKKGAFNFVIDEDNFYCSVGFNILEDNIIVNRISKTSKGEYSTTTEKVISFSGEGEKINK